MARATLAMAGAIDVSTRDSGKTFVCKHCKQQVNVEAGEAPSGSRDFGRSTTRHYIDHLTPEGTPCPGSGQRPY